MILFLDDSEERIKQFQSRYPDAVIVRTAQDAIHALSSIKEWDWVSLDHDLGGVNYSGPGPEPNAMPVIEWIEHNRPVIHRITIHSWNFPAAQRMHMAMWKAGYRVDRIFFGM